MIARRGDYYRLSAATLHACKHTPHYDTRNVRRLTVEPDPLLFAPFPTPSRHMSFIRRICSEFRICDYDGHIYGTWRICTQLF